MSKELRNVRLEEIKTTKTYPKKDGTGDVNITKVKVDGKYFTSFSKEHMKTLKVGDLVDVFFTEKENEYEGKNYTNRNLSLICLTGVGEVSSGAEITPETQNKIDAAKKVMEETGTNATNPEFAKKVEEATIEVIKGVNTINVGDKTYKVTLEEIK